MMTVDEITPILKMLSANYGENFYKGTSQEDVIILWSTQFVNDDPREVKKGVQNCINTLSYRPTIADIRKRMAKSKMQGQMTATEAFQVIHKAVNSIYDKDTATKAFNDFPPIIRRVVGSPSILVSWSRVSDEAFMTVVMSAIRESYKELAQQELDYNALPSHLKRGADWMVEAPSQQALPEPEKAKSVDEIIAEANARAAEHGMQMTPELQEKHASRVSDFLKPMTVEEIKAVKEKE